MAMSTLPATLSQMECCLTVRVSAAGLLICRTASRKNPNGFRNSVTTGRRDASMKCLRQKCLLLFFFWKGMIVASRTRRRVQRQHFPLPLHQGPLLRRQIARSLQKGTNARGGLNWFQLRRGMFCIVNTHQAGLRWLQIIYLLTTTGMVIMHAAISILVRKTRTEAM